MYDHSKMNECDIQTNLSLFVRRDSAASDVQTICLCQNRLHKFVYHEIQCLVANINFSISGSSCGKRGHFVHQLEQHTTNAFLPAIIIPKLTMKLKLVNTTLIQKWEGTISILLENMNEIPMKTANQTKLTLSTLFLDFLSLKGLALHYQSASRSQFSYSVLPIQMLICHTLYIHYRICSVLYIVLLGNFGIRFFL